MSSKRRKGKRKKRGSRDRESQPQAQAAAAAVQDPDDATGGEGGSALLSPRFLLGLVFLLVSLGASIVLAGKSLNLLEAPGCGEGSPCAEAAASSWGKVPVLNWPVSFLGLAYFTALTFGWVAGHLRGGVPTAFQNVVRVGAAVSVMFLLAMIFGGYVCAYCVTVHVGNFALLFVVELTPRAAVTARPILAWGAAGFVLVTAVQAGLKFGIAAEQEKLLDESIQEIIAKGDRASPLPEGKAFTGRYRLGPERAPIRIVAYTDYQCPECADLEESVAKLVAERDDVSFSHKHHPFNKDCNPYVKSNPHKNACWAARAAEAAAILRGEEGFWEMNHWLFERGGSFTNDELRQALVGFDYDWQEFVDTMQIDEVGRRIREDIDEAQSFGITQTPFVFINGVELKGAFASRSIKTAVEELAATNPPPGDATQDRPPPAMEKFVGDWTDGRPVRALPDQRAWTFGPPDAPAYIVVWGDLQEPNTAEADVRIRGIVSSRSDTRYTFRHFPIDMACNPASPRTLHPKACRAAQAAEAAGLLGGNDAYWDMHVWLMENQETFNDQTLAAFARNIGLDPNALFAQMQSPSIAQEIANDSQAAKQLGVRGIPFIFLNNRRVYSWRRTIETIVEYAAQEPGPPG